MSSEPVFTDEDEQQEYELALLEGYTPEEARKMAWETRVIFMTG
jgi:hypothetical protein